MVFGSQLSASTLKPYLSHFEGTDIAVQSYFKCLPVLVTTKRPCFTPRVLRI